MMIAVPTSLTSAGLYRQGIRCMSSPSLPGQYGGEGETAYFSFRVNVGARTVL